MRIQGVPENYVQFALITSARFIIKISIRSAGIILVLNLSYVAGEVDPSTSSGF